ncbi:intra-flagellar transport protein 57 domain-containing protein [Ditylenchus destructor]|uniref:Intra-flagellar transport protein 57 domain-containing protein n=1 Tax=Ditylenchus destructor TaxID=166010 RepID=A0AAD4RD15_9BILA|nr:intra-flagellar transport protein 57 domain-containing protein [Ditylenchus destructor]
MDEPILGTPETAESNNDAPEIEPNGFATEPPVSTKKEDGEKSSTEEGPGQKFSAYLLNETIVERLKLLNYESEFVPKSDSYKVIPRHYFVNRTNTGEQFFLFTHLAVWLINDKAQIAQLEMPHEFDDPNMTISNILGALKTKAIDIPFSPNKLKSGSGEQCLYILDKLTLMAVAKVNFLFSKIEMSEELLEGTDDGEEQVDEAEITTDQLEDEEEVAVAEDEDDEEAALVRGLGFESREPLYANELDEEPLKEILHNFTDVNTMNAELNRVIPQLKITIRSNLKDWRMHAEQMQKYQNVIQDQFKEIQPYLRQSTEEIAQSTERIQSRENNLNDQFDSLLQVYRIRKNELAAISEQYRESSGTLNSRTETLNNLNGEIEQLKQQIEDQGMQNTNGTPIMKIKQSISKLEAAITTLRIQIVVAEQALFQSQLSHRVNMTIEDIAD